MSMNILKSLNRRLLGLTHSGQALAREGYVSGGEGRATIVHNAPDTAAVFDDFYGANDGDTGSLALRAGAFRIGFSDTGQLLPSTGVIGAANGASGATNGVFRLTSSASSTQTPVGGAQTLSTVPGWKANQGRLRMGARVKIADLAKNNVFVGFTDTGGAELPVYDTGATAGILTPAADYAGFLKGGGAGATATGLTWRLVAGKAGVDQVATTGVTPTTNVYDTLEVEVSSDGEAVTGYINGKPVAKITSAAVTATTALAAGVFRSNTEAAADAVDVDWINVSAGRDTGE
jgi:hypothetical protein